MAVTLKQTANTGSCGTPTGVYCASASLGPSPNNREITSSGTDTGTWTADASNLGTDEAEIYLQYDADSAGYDGASGTWTINLDVTSAGNMNWDETYVCYLPSGCGGTPTTLGSNIGHATSLNSTGLKTVQVTQSSSQTIGSGDIIMIVGVVDNNEAHGATAATIRVHANGVSAPGSEVSAVSGAASVTCSASVSAAPSKTVPGAATASGTASINAQPNRRRPGIGALSCSATATASGAIIQKAAASVTGSAIVNAQSRRYAGAESSVTASASVSATAQRTRRSASSQTGTATAVAVGSVSGAIQAAASVNATATVNAVPTITRYATTAVTGSATAQAAGSILGAVQGAASVTASASTTAVGLATRGAVSNVSGTATAVAVGSVATGGVTVNGAASVTASASTSARAGYRLTAVGSVTCSASVNAVGGLVTVVLYRLKEFAVSAPYFDSVVQSRPYLVSCAIEAPGMDDLDVQQIEGY